MIYCEKIKNYVDQEVKCLRCIYYVLDNDSCYYLDWHIEDNNKNDIEEIGHA